MVGGSGPKRWWTAVRGWPRAAQIVAVAVALLVALGTVSAATTSTTTKPDSAPTTSTPSTTSTSVAASRSPSDQPDPFHPSPSLTPGATFASASKDQVCVRGYTASVRSVSESDRNRVYEAYGVASADRENYVIDHLIPLELGGSNDASNLWPEPRQADTNDSKDKDNLENELHDLVCSGEVSLAVAQQAIVHWDTVDVATLVSTTTTTTAPTTTTTTTAPATTVPPTTVPPVTAPATTVSVAPDCTPGYDPCIPPGPDVDCAGGTGNGPRYVTGPVYVTGSDPYDLDRDGDGVGCA